MKIETEPRKDFRFNASVRPRISNQVFLIWLIGVVALILLSGCGTASAMPVSTPTATVLFNTPTPVPTATQQPTPTPSPTPLNPLTIDYLRQRNFPGSDITIEQTLAPGSNYNRYIASYQSDGLKIFALLTVPKTTKPQTGFPVIIFNHGFIPPAQYRTTERYVAYVDAFARNGYIVFKSDYRGHGNSQGEATGGYGSPDYTIDVLNAIASIKKFPSADPNRIGMWGHSMGGQVTLRAMVVSKDIKAGAIWSGVVGTYPDLISNWHHSVPIPSERIPNPGRNWRKELTQLYGTPEENPGFWNSISPNSYVADLSGPLQLQFTPADPEVPFEFSQTLASEILAAGKTVETFSYPNDDHNLSKHLAQALDRSVAFFDKYVKAYKSN